MKDEEIIALAIEKGERVAKSFKSMNEVFYVYEFSKPELIAFARAIADLQKEKDAKICEPTSMYSPSDWTEYAKIRSECADDIRSAK